MLEIPSETPALSVRQPWAELILSGKKLIEVRQWKNPYRGLLWLHTGLTSDLAGEQEYNLTNLFKGGFIGIIKLESIKSFDQKRWQAWRHLHLDRGEYYPGLYAWFITTQYRFEEPIPSPGKLKLFLPSEDIDAQLRKGIE